MGDVGAGRGYVRHGNAQPVAIGLTAHFSGAGRVAKRWLIATREDPGRVG